MNLHVLQVDDKAHLDESHDYPEGLFVTDGEIHLLVDGKAIAKSLGGITGERPSRPQPASVPIAAGGTPALQGGTHESARAAGR
jgi:hypothetical protein